MTSQQRKTIFPMLQECGCPKDRDQRIAWVNGLLCAFKANMVIASLNDLNDTQVSWLIGILGQRIQEAGGYRNAA